MARADYDGTIDYWWVTTIADTSAPTKAEIDAGTNLTPSMVPDTYGFDRSESDVDSRDLSSLFESQHKGTWGGSGELMLFGNDDDSTADDTAVDLFSAHATAGYIVELPHPATLGEATADDLANVWPVEAGIAHLQKGAANTKQRYRVSFATTDEPDLRVAVVA